MNLREIAVRLNVSPASVSIVRWGRPGVSPLTRRRIQIALEENGFTYKAYYQAAPYAPPAAGGDRQHDIQLLKYRKSALLTDKNEGFVDAIINAIDDLANSASYTLLLKSVSHEEYPAFLQTIDSARCMGLLVIATEMDRADICALSRINVPIVILDSDHPNLPFCTVTMHNRDLAYEAIAHLYAASPGPVGYVASSIRTGNFIGRENGCREALAAHGQSWDDALVFSLTPSIQGAHADMLRELEKGRRVPGALFADNDILAIGAMRALREAGFRIPEDVRIIGVDNTPLAQIAVPPLSSMQISRAALGQEAFSALLARTAAPDGEILHVRVGSRLVQRESTWG